MTLPLHVLAFALQAPINTHTDEPLIVTNDGIRKMTPVEIAKGQEYIEKQEARAAQAKREQANVKHHKPPTPAAKGAFAKMAPKVVND